jgi:16S rRNA (uracil1498-N3)-methyltransferase
MSRIFLRLSISLNTVITISNADVVHYLFSVLRIKKGDNLIIFNSIDGEFLAEITSIGKSICTVNVIKLLRLVCHTDYQFQNLYFGISLIKQDRFLDCLDMLTQLGVLNLFPLEAQYTQKIYLKLDKIEKRTINAIQQSGRIILPNINSVITLKQFLDFKQEGDIMLCGDKNGMDFDNLVKQWKKQFTSNILNINKLFLLIGPEGGFSNEEINLISSYSNTFFIQLSKYNLRAETAAVSLFCNLQALHNLLNGV